MGGRCAPQFWRIGMWVCPLSQRQMCNETRIQNIGKRTWLCIYKSWNWHIFCWSSNAYDWETMFAIAFSSLCVATLHTLCLSISFVSCWTVTSELIFEQYSVPAVAFCVDSLMSFYHNNLPPQNSAFSSDGLVISFNTASTSVIPILSGKGIMSHAKRYHKSSIIYKVSISCFIRIPWGGSQATEYLLKLIQLKYPNFPTRVTPPQCSVGSSSSCVFLVFTSAFPVDPTKFLRIFPWLPRSPANAPKSTQLACVWTCGTVSICIASNRGEDRRRTGQDCGEEEGTGQEVAGDGGGEKEGKGVGDFSGNSLTYYYFATPSSCRRRMT